MWMQAEPSSAQWLKTVSSSKHKLDISMRILFKVKNDTFNWNWAQKTRYPDTTQVSRRFLAANGKTERRRETGSGERDVGKVATELSFQTTINGFRTSSRPPIFEIRRGRLKTGLIMSLLLKTVRRWRSASNHRSRDLHATSTAYRRAVAASEGKHHMHSRRRIRRLDCPPIWQRKAQYRELPRSEKSWQQPTDLSQESSLWLQRILHLQPSTWTAPRCRCRGGSKVADDRTGRPRLGMRLNVTLNLRVRNRTYDYRRKMPNTLPTAPPTSSPASWTVDNLGIEPTTGRRQERRERGRKRKWPTFWFTIFN